MDFAITEEHRMVRRMVRDFAQREIAPVIKEYNRAQEMAHLRWHAWLGWASWGFVFHYAMEDKAWITSP